MCININASWQVWISWMWDCIKRVIIARMPALLLSSRHFISFPFCWFWFTRGSQRAPSEGGELHPQGLRSVRAGICSFWRLEMIWNLSWLIQCCLGFTESVPKDGGPRARVCDCVVSAFLCTPPAGAQILCPLPAFMWFLPFSPGRLIPIALYIGYVLAPFIQESVVIPDSDPSLTWYIRNDSKYCTRRVLHLPD